MAMAEEQQQQSQAMPSDVENIAYVSNQVSSKSVQKPLRNGVEKTGEGVQNELHTENKKIAATEATTEISNGGIDNSDQQLYSEGSAASVGSDLAAGDREKETSVKKVGSLIVEETPVSLGHESLVDKEEEDDDAVGESVEEVGATTDGAQQLMECNSEDTVVDTGRSIQSDNAVGVMSLPVQAAQSGNGTGVDKLKDNDDREMNAVLSVPQKVKKTDIAAVRSSEEKETMADNLSKDVEVAAEDASVCAAVVEHSSLPLEESDTGGEARQSSAEVKEAVGLTVTTLVNNVVDSVDETVFLDAQTAKVPSSPICMPHLSADEAIELLEVHQGDDHDFLPEHDEIADADVEAESNDHRYQWFDGDDEDDEGVTIDAPSVLDVAPETTDDVFGFGGVVDLTDVTPALEENANMNSDESADTVVVPGSSSSSSASSRSSSSSSSSSSCRSVSSSEDEGVDLGLKKRRISGNKGPRKLLKHKKQKRVRSSEPDSPSRRRFKRKRKIPKPVIPSEFAIFDAEAADPILKGSYSVRNNRRACFQGNWGFGDEAFHNIESVSPFEYTSHARVLQSRRKDDKRPISGKYRGFFKLRQFDRSLIRIREDQVDLQFLPMPSSDEEDEGEDEDMEGYESDDDEGGGYEAAASRYIVLGKGKNRFGRFLIRGYLSPESGRLTVKRRYLE